jgi:hypothetical protein
MSLPHGIHVSYSDSGPRRHRNLPKMRLFRQFAGSLPDTRLELWETKISRPATLDECVGDNASIEAEYLDCIAVCQSAR